MPTRVLRAAPLPLRRILPAAIIAVAATLASTALVDPATANAELDVGYYDQCLADVNQRFREGDIPVEFAENEYRFCCYAAGGRWEPGEFFGDCAAPPAIAASTPSAPPSEAAPDVPAGPPPTKPGPKPSTPKTSLTLAPLTPVTPVG